MWGAGRAVKTAGRHFTGASGQTTMTRIRAAGPRLLALILLGSAAGLAGCSSIDQALTGRQAQETHTAAPAPAAAPAEPAPAPEEGTQEAALPPAGAAPAAETPAPQPLAAPVAIEAGSDTGTNVNKTIQGLRSQLQTIENALGVDAQHQAEIAGRDAQAIATYEDGSARIATRLQVGTTRGNPDLVSQWNTAQAALDTLSSDINALAGVASDLSGQTAAARQLLPNVETALNAPGAVDEDHRQLTVLDDETHRTIATLDHLFGEVSRTVQRQTAFVAQERPRLTRLADAIRNGDFAYGVVTPVAAAAGDDMPVAPGGPPIVTIKFDRPGVDYRQTLYSALSQALQTRPGASFNIIAVSPTGGSAEAVQLAQSDAQHHAQDVMHSMTQMGVPAARLGVSSSTDPSVATSEVRVYVR